MPSRCRLWANDSVYGDARFRLGTLVEDSNPILVLPSPSSPGIASDWDLQALCYTLCCDVPVSRVLLPIIDQQQSFLSTKSAQNDGQMIVRILAKSSLFTTDYSSDKAFYFFTLIQDGSLVLFRSISASIFHSIIHVDGIYVFHRLKRSVTSDRPALRIQTFGNEATLSVLSSDTQQQEHLAPVVSMDISALLLFKQDKLAKTV